MAPTIRYAKTLDGAHIAYQVLGEGADDLLYVSGFASNLSTAWELPAQATFLSGLTSMSRLILMDRRGPGCLIQSSTSLSHWTHGWTT